MNLLCACQVPGTVLNSLHVLLPVSVNSFYKLIYEVPTMYQASARC